MSKDKTEAPTIHTEESNLLALVNRINQAITRLWSGNPLTEEFARIPGCEIIGNQLLSAQLSMVPILRAAADVIYKRIDELHALKYDTGARPESSPKAKKT